MDAPIDVDVLLAVEVPEFENSSFGEKDEPLKESGLGEERSDHSSRTSSDEDAPRLLANTAGRHDGLVSSINTSRKFVCT